jgi:hypothetical protein
MVQIKNFTPHPIHLLGEGNQVIRTFESEGLVRLKTSTVSAGFSIAGIPVTKTVFGELEGLPEFVDGTYIIVSQLVKSALPNRTDLLVPAEVVRDDKGNIIGCKSFGI